MFGYSVAFSAVRDVKGWEGMETDNDDCVWGTTGHMNTHRRVRNGELQNSKIGLGPLDEGLS